MQSNGMIFWDWNGTLMDDVDFTHGCLNWMLETHGYPQRYDLNEYREIFGFPIEEYYTEMLLRKPWQAKLNLRKCHRK